MPSKANNREIFDSRAETYNLEVPSSTEFPLAGYGKVHAELLSCAEVEPGMSILDLGIGTGNLVGHFLLRDCSVWAADETRDMLQELPLEVDYVQASYCGGIFRLRLTSGATGYA